MLLSPKSYIFHHGKGAPQAQRQLIDRLGSAADISVQARTGFFAPLHFAVVSPFEC
jgi:hypothetical protein